MSTSVCGDLEKTRGECLYFIPLVRTKDLKRLKIATPIWSVFVTHSTLQNHYIIALVKGVITWSIMNSAFKSCPQG
jgi:hypothetical protein